MVKKEEDKKNHKVDLAVVLGYIAVKDERTIEKKVGVLAQLGYSNRDMALICGTNENVIRATKSNIEKPTTKTRGKGNGKG